MILLDTNVLSELTKPRPSPQVVAWLKANEPLLAVPTIALAELHWGLQGLGRIGREPVGVTTGSSN
ncbi:MAG: type II toxin-antitoxin system VapC family toxin [Acidobacteria bacterium]|nr:type II toxin-antitoxin system VapC family toxin [Acidobacteriota bacterium]